MMAMRSALKQASGAIAGGLLLAGTALTAMPAQAQAPAKPNILVIMGDDVGWFNIGA
jgi:arylsulfatase